MGEAIAFYTLAALILGFAVLVITARNTVHSVLFLVANFLFVAAMWFQDLFTYDFRRTEMCIIPYGTQEGEISFCAYNTGVGWRNVIEKMHMSCTTAEWHKKYGRHTVYANRKPLELDSYDHNLVVDPAAVNRRRTQGSAGEDAAAQEQELVQIR